MTTHYCPQKTQSLNRVTQHVLTGSSALFVWPLRHLSSHKDVLVHPKAEAGAEAEASLTPVATVQYSTVQCRVPIGLSCLTFLPSTFCLKNESLAKGQSTHLGQISTRPVQLCLCYRTFALNPPHGNGPSSPAHYLHITCLLLPGPVSILPPG